MLTRVFHYDRLRAILCTEHSFYRGGWRSDKKDQRSLTGFPEAESPSATGPEECKLAARLAIITQVEVQKR